MGHSIDDIRRLTARWLAGETTLAEEAALREFFGGNSSGGDGSGGCGGCGVRGGDSNNFGDAQDELPADLEPCRLLFGQSARAAGERSRRNLVLHTPSAGERATKQRATKRHSLAGWTIAAASAAAAVAAIVVAVAVFTPAGSGPGAESHSGDIVCLVNGERITDPDRIEAYTREALRLANDNLRRPGQSLSSELGGDPAMVRVGEMLNELIKNQ